jgi:hypothetical protein
VRARLGSIARAHVDAVADPARAAFRLLRLARECRGGPVAKLEDGAGAPAAMAATELRWVARSLGLAGAPSDAEALAASLFV